MKDILSLIQASEIYNDENLIEFDVLLVSICIQ